MKIANIADAHLNRTSYRNENDIVFTNLSFRSADFMKAFEWIIDKNINELHPDLVVFPGDIYDNFHPSNTSTAFFNAQVTKLAEARIPSIVLVGNHEVCQTNHALSSLKALKLKNIKVIDEPCVIKFKDTNLALFPYSIAIEQKQITMVKAFNTFIESIPKDLPIFFFGHFGVKGAITNKYSVNASNMKIEKSLVNKNENDITISDLERIGASYIFLGDYHRHQILPVKNSFAFYTGSIEKTDMSENKEDKGFIFYDSDCEELSDYGKCRFIQYPNTRPMIELSGNYGEMTKALFELADDSKNAIVKLKFSGTNDERNEFENNRKDLEKLLKNKIDPIYISKQINIVDEEEDAKASEIEQEIIEKGNLSDKEVMDIVMQIISEKEKNKEECDKLCEMANNIFLSVKK